MELIFSRNSKTQTICDGKKITFHHTMLPVFCYGKCFGLSGFSINRTENFPRKKRFIDFGIIILNLLFPICLFYFFKTFDNLPSSRSAIVDTGFAIICLFCLVMTLFTAILFFICHNKFHQYYCGIMDSDDGVSLKKMFD